ncbi:MAG: HEAT repeat domain-containing protein [Planctomycetes bacterium]|nr:HEAT repeat domain-containing protein [Planctomycetota bacterium]
MNHSVRVLLPLLTGLWLPIALGAAEEARITLDESTRAKCLQVLRNGLHGDEFWPAMHAAEGLTLGGDGPEIIEFLRPKLKTEVDDQKRCGLAREIARAGDRSTVVVMLQILAADEKYGHTHAAESLFKVFETGDGKALRRAFSQNDNLTLKLMSAAALARGGDKPALETVRKLLGHDDPKHAAIAAWILGQIGDRSDIPRLKAQLGRISDSALKANFEHALAILGDDDGLTALLRNLTSDNDSIRTYAATFAGDARAVGAAERLKVLLQDPFPDARIRAAQSLLVLASPGSVPVLKPSKD